MRYITADYIFPVSSLPVKDGIIVIDGKGKIAGIETSNFQLPTSNLEKYEGIICPGFINAHCHLELSYMKGMISERLGMAGFIKGILSNRNTSSQEQIAEAIGKSEEEMYKGGIVGIGDISNNDSTFFQKAKGKIKYHTFFEVFDLDPAKAKQVYINAEALSKEYHEQLYAAGLLSSSSIVPHAPYSVSPELFQLIASQKSGALISYHNQESIAESELYKNKTGTIEKLFSSIGIKLDYIKADGKNSLQSTLSYFSSQHKLLFVHNTYTTKKDIDFLTSHFSLPIFYFCFCPNANLYIEGRLPDINLFMYENCNIVVGTDSLASNHSLSILEELKTISTYFPYIPLQTLLTWATQNAAEFFGWEKELGTLEAGKTPGLVLIEDVDLDSLRLKKNSRSRRLL